MSKKQFKIKSVIFDLDGVITNTMPDHYRAWKRIFDDEGLKLSHYDIYCREGQPGMQSIKEIFAKYGLKFTRKYAQQMLDKKERLFKRDTEVRFINGARWFLKRLHKDDFELALVTGTAAHEVKQILPLYLRNLFSVIITGSDVKNGKPHPEPYLKALAALGIKPKDAIVIENAPFGIQSARDAGIPCLAIETSLPKKYLNKANAVFQSIADLEKNVQLQLKP